ncbi:MAG TPA: carbohydrate-binding protein [Anaerolineales bacterium]|nr:carbohydrate-binding protein [Anaerolineales bacterium]
MKRSMFIVVAALLLVSLVLVVPVKVGAANRGAWAPNVAYAVGDTVTYNGVTYQCIQAHTSLTGWEPPNVPALWQPISATNTPGGATSTFTRTPTRTNTSVGPTPTRTNTPVPPTNTPTPGSGTCNGLPQYVAGTTYTQGQLVQNVGNQYRCDVGGWCSSTAAWAYAPGTGQYWTSAWTLIGACGPAGTATRTPTNVPPPPPGSKIFAPYIDVSPGSGSAIMQLASNGSGNKHYTLAFILGAGCNATWFGAYPMNTAEADAIGTRINELRAAGGDVIVSFGGAAAPELADVCGDAASLQAQYQAVVTKYNLKYVDFDIEDFPTTAIDNRNKALKGLEAANPGLQVHYTLGVLETGFTQPQMDVLNNARTNGTRVDLVNIMAMDYGHSVADMYGAAVSAAQGARTWLNNNGFSGTQLGITPMIGVNDSAGETFSLANATSLVSWANSNGITELAFWSVGRDNGGCPGGGAASPSCSGISQSTFQFSSIFHGFAP